jgi:hypothetical protein
MSYDVKTSLGLAPGLCIIIGFFQVGCSTIQIVQGCRKSELCQRYIPQIVLGGQHVTLVQIIL